MLLQETADLVGCSHDRSGTAAGCCGDEAGFVCIMRVASEALWLILPIAAKN